jgi:hypothetical protein
MKPELFVDALKHDCRDAAARDCLASFEKPPGQRPRQELMHLSQWFTALSESDRALVTRAMREAADATLFGVLCVNEGVRPIESEGEKSEFSLLATRAGIQSQISPTETYLHDLLRAEP